MILYGACTSVDLLSVAVVVGLLILSCFIFKACASVRQPCILIKPSVPVDIGSHGAMFHCGSSVNVLGTSQKPARVGRGEMSVPVGMGYCWATVDKVATQRSAAAGGRLTRNN